MQWNLVTRQFRIFHFHHPPNPKYQNASPHATQLFLKGWHISNKSILYPSFIWPNVTPFSSQINPPVSIIRRTVHVHILYSWHVILTLHLLWQMFCMSLVLLHLLHVVSINFLLHISFKYLRVHIVHFHCIIFSNHPLIPQYCYLIWFSEVKVTYIFNFVKEDQVWQFTVHIYLNIYIFVYIHKYFF